MPSVTSVKDSFINILVPGKTEQLLVKQYIETHPHESVIWL